MKKNLMIKKKEENFVLLYFKRFYEYESGIEAEANEVKKPSMLMSHEI